MKITGIVRKVDTLGRIVIPMEFRKVMDIKESDSLEIALNDGQVILRKFNTSCAFCGSDEDVIKYDNIAICSACRNKIKKIL